MEIINEKKERELTVSTRNEVEDRYSEEAERLEEEAKLKALEEMMGSLGGYLFTAFTNNKMHHETYVRPVLDTCLRLSSGEYDEKTLSMIRDGGGTEINLPLASQVASTAEAWLIDIVASSSSGNRPWGLKPTPVPELPEGLDKIIKDKIVKEGEEAESQGVKPEAGEIQQRASKIYDVAFEEVDRIAHEAVKHQEVLISDVLEEAGFTAELKKLINYITIYPSAFILGPIFKKAYENKWLNSELIQTEVLKEQYKTISPYDVFPAPDVDNLNNGDLFYRAKMSRRELSELYGLEGVDENALNLVMEGFSKYSHWTNTSDYVKKTTETKAPVNTLGKHTSEIEVVYYFVTVPVDIFIESMGITDDEKIKELKNRSVLEIEGLMVDKEIVRTVIVDSKVPFFKRPIYGTSYRKIPGSLWGKSVIMLAEQIDSICNSCTRALVNNMSICSGPLVALDVNSIPQGQSIESIHPLQIFQINKLMQNTNDLPIKFYQPSSNSKELLGVFNNYLNHMLHVCGIPPSLMGGNAKQGAAATAKGLEALISSSSKGFTLALSNITEDIIVPVVYNQFTTNLVKGTSKYIYGDVRVIAQGFNAIVQAGAQEERTLEFLKLLGNPKVYNILGMEGTADLLRDYGSIIGLDISGAIPSNEKLKEKQQAMQENAPPTPEEVQKEIAQMKIEADLKKAEDRNRLQQEKLELDKIRSQQDYDIRMKELEIELEKTKMRNESDIEVAVANSMAKMKMQQNEIAVKDRTGSGI
jgi:hypothetical protein